MTPSEIVSTCTTPSSLQEAIEEAIREAAEKAWEAAVKYEDWKNYADFFNRNKTYPPDKSTYLSQYNQQP
jgi:hypothetical protein